ncbi:hypothetical protein TCAL_16970 [Tigriopus californicus]|uniref:Uncharacterized protein n=1 Tax=Tigriopus californicus TaxID=6832 RepID=A0A553PG73_TIGCA|nr:hypothetical protein TCAL_16970 [Tigriopus californicus]
MDSTAEYQHARGRPKIIREFGTLAQLELSRAASPAPVHPPDSDRHGRGGIEHEAEWPVREHHGLDEHSGPGLTLLTRGRSVGGSRSGPHSGDFACP